MIRQAEHWGGATATGILLAILVALDIFVPGVRHWFDTHELTSSVIAGLMVLLITVLVANRVVRLRQLQERSRAIAAQAAIVMSQAGRASRAVGDFLADPQAREPAVDEVRTLMTMLLISGPLLIDARVSRTFLEDAQRLGAELARALGGPRDSDPVDVSRTRIDRAVTAVRTSARPLVAVLKPEQLSAADPEDGPDSDAAVTLAPAPGGGSTG